MYNKLLIIFIIVFALKINFTFSCSKLNKYKFTPNPKNSEEKVSSICEKIDASHFFVDNLNVNLKKNDGNIIRLNHFKTLLPDGYNFCSLKSENSLILD